MPDPETLDPLDLRRGQDHQAATDLEVDSPPEDDSIDDIDREHYLDTIGG